MPEVKGNPENKAWAPPVFPVGGRLPMNIPAVSTNFERQEAEQSRFKQGKNSRGQSRRMDCCHSLHISLFFDGTNNNEYNDTKNNHPSNIAKLFHASLQGAKAEERGYFSYYMPGVGTAFPEIGEFDYSEEGLRFATGGEDRINWALVAVTDALHMALNKTPLSMKQRASGVAAMSTWKAPLMSMMGAGKRRSVMMELLKPLQARIELARPRVLGVKLFVYGFSRGAAQARTFVNWLSQLFETPAGGERPEQTLIGLPISVEFLGILDTVASVGIANVAPFFAGHMDWADDTQLLPDAKTYPDFVKCCRHFVASFEQRACFPLDSIRDEDGHYPPNSYEVVYPGVHSDVGGGYPQNDQGKARGGTNELLSQIVLHDMYAEAFAAGAPLQVPETVLSQRLMLDKAWRAMSEASNTEFDINPQLIERFNAWRHTFPGISTEPPTTPAWEYKPHPLNTTVEDTLADQLGWITGWRIGRYANDSYKLQPFFTQATEVSSYDGVEGQKAFEKQKKIALASRLKAPEAAVGSPGPPIYEPQIDKTQLSQAAAEFKRDYLGLAREQTSWQASITDVLLRDSIYLINANDEAKDHASLKAAGEQRTKLLFRDDRGTPVSDTNLALLVALLDDQVHDSRAWFMHDALKSRELWAGYFFYRMTYFGNDNSRDLSPVVVAGRVLGVAMLAGATVYGIRRDGPLDWAGGMIAGISAATIGYRVIDKASGMWLPFLPEAEQLLRPTSHIGAVASALKQQIALEDYAQRIERSKTMLRAAGSLIELPKEVV